MLSALVVAHNEEEQLPACLATLRFADGSDASRVTGWWPNTSVGRSLS